MSLRHVVVTGAASGIGRRIAVRFGADGAMVSAVDADVAGLESLGAEIERVQTTRVDLAEPDAATTMITEAWQRAPVDVLVNAAGVYPATPFLGLDAACWDRVQQINVRAPLLATVALARRMIDAGRTGSVINISSGAALRARPGAAPYATSKAALEMATRASALELGPYGIRVNAVSPGFVTVDSTVNPVTEEYAAAVSANPLGRRGEPDDIARAVFWLAGSEADWVTGTVLRVDGGASTGAHTLPLHWNARAADRPSSGERPRTDENSDEATDEKENR